MKKLSRGEESMALQLRAFQMPESVREYRFDESRRWRFDFAWPVRKIAMEVEGGTWSGGRHSRGKGFMEDCEKYNSAQIDGWMVLRVTTEQVEKGQAITLLKRAMRY